MRLGRIERGIGVCRYYLEYLAAFLPVRKRPAGHLFCQIEESSQASDKTEIVVEFAVRSCWLARASKSLAQFSWFLVKIYTSIYLARHTTYLPTQHLQHGTYSSFYILKVILKSSAFIKEMVSDNPFESCA